MEALQISFGKYFDMKAESNEKRTTKEGWAPPCTQTSALRPARSMGRREENQDGVQILSTISTLLLFSDSGIDPTI